MRFFHSITKYIKQAFIYKVLGIDPEENDFKFKNQNILTDLRKIFSFHFPESFLKSIKIKIKKKLFYEAP